MKRLKIPEDTKEHFHSVTEKLLHLGKRAWPDIETDIAFLCTIVDIINVEYRKKLKGVITWL